MTGGSLSQGVLRDYEVGGCRSSSRPTPLGVKTLQAKAPISSYDRERCCYVFEETPLDLDTEDQLHEGRRQHEASRDAVPKKQVRPLVRASTKRTSYTPPASRLRNVSSVAASIRSSLQIFPIQTKSTRIMNGYCKWSASGI